MDISTLSGEILSLTCELVKVDSVAGAEGPCADVLMAYFNKKAVPARLQEVAPQRWNVLAGSETCRPNLLLNGHMDMVDTVDGWSTADPHKLELIDGYMIGSGVCNMKAALASMAVSTAYVWREGCRDILFAGVIGECQELGLGTNHFLKSGGDAAFAIVGEPTSMFVQTTHTGTYQARITFTGIPVHTGESERGVNALDAAFQFVLDLKESKLTPPGSGPFEGTPRVLVGRMSGGFYAQVTAPDASVWLDVRIPPGVDLHKIESAVDAVAQKSASSVSAGWNRTTLAFEPAYCSSKDSTPYLDHLVQAYTQTSNSNLEFGFATPSNKFFATDAAHLQAAGVPSLVFGPGKWTIGPDESVSLAEATEYSATLINFALLISTGRLGR